MSKFWVTFGSQYAREKHPTMLGAHPDGWLTVEADDEVEARELVIKHLDRAWSMLYSQDEHRPDDLFFYPRGRIGILTKDGLITEVEIVARALQGQIYHCVDCIDDIPGPDEYPPQPLDPEHEPSDRWALDTAAVVLDAIYKRKGATLDVGPEPVDVIYKRKKGES